MGSSVWGRGWHMLSGVMLWDVSQAFMKPGFLDNVVSNLERSSTVTSSM